jgi:hypothetical protein
VLFRSPEAQVTIWEDNIVNNKKYYYLDNNNNKIYFDDKDIINKNSSCYDPTIQIGTRQIKKDDIKLDQQRTYTPGQKIEKSIKKLLKDNLYSKEDTNKINERYTALKNSNWIETETINPELSPCTKLDAKYTDWKVENNKCECNGSKTNPGYLTAKLIRTRTNENKYGGEDKDKEPGIVSKFIICDKTFGKLNFTDSGLCPQDGKFTESNKTKWFAQPLKDITDSEGCKPIYGTSRTKIEKAEYTFPIETGNHHTEIEDDFDTKSPEFKNLNDLNIYELSNTKNNNTSTILTSRDKTKSFKFTRIGDKNNAKVFELERTSNCKPKAKFKDSDIKKLWKNTTGCDQDLTDEILLKNSNMNIKDYTYESNNTNFLNVIIPWIKTNILQYTIKDSNRSIMKDNTNILNQCYKTLPIKLTEKNRKDYLQNDVSILYPGVEYSNGFIWKKGNFTMIIENTGNLCIYKNYNLTKLNNDLYWSSETENNTDGYLAMQNDGNLVVYDKGNNAKWSSGTADNNGGYAELLLSKSENYPLLVIKNKDGQIKKYINKITLNLVNNDIYLYKKNYILLKGGDEEVLNDPTCIYPYIDYSNGFTWKNGNFKLTIEDNGNLVLYNSSKESIWNTQTTGDANNTNILSMRRDGNLVIYENGKGKKWFFTPEMAIYHKLYTVFV